MMNKKIKKEWVKRLRSGEYEQGTGRLCMNDRFCCLGVLCDMAEEEGLIEGLMVGERSSIDYISFHDGEKDSNYLPYIVREWSELEATNPIVSDNGSYTFLAGLNDSGRSFNDIATIIEEQL